MTLQPKRSSAARIHLPFNSPLNSPLPSSLHSQSGESLLSLLMAMSLMALLLSLGLSGYQRWRSHCELEAALLTLTQFMQRGLRQAHGQQHTLVMCDTRTPTCHTDWSQGITLRSTAAGTPLLQAHWPAGIQVSGPAHRLFLTPRAFDSEANGTFWLCPTAGDGRQLIFNRLGQVRYAPLLAEDCQRRSPRQTR